MLDGRIDPPSELLMQLCSSFLFSKSLKPDDVEHSDESVSWLGYGGHLCGGFIYNIHDDQPVAGELEVAGNRSQSIRGGRLLVLSFPHHTTQCSDTGISSAAV